jgi:hypothetical protein
MAAKEGQEMVKIQVDVTKKGVRFDPPVPIVKRLDKIELEMNFWQNSEIDSVELSEFVVLREQAGSYVEHKSATTNWHSKRGQSRKFTRANRRKQFGGRGNVGGAKNLLVKFKVTMVHKNGTTMNVDPILDERPGG